MKFWMTVAALLCIVMPVQAKKLKTPKSHSASGYNSHKAPKVKAHKMSKTQKNKFKNRMN
jgi:hypothetical protein